MARAIILIYAVAALAVAIWTRVALHFERKRGDGPPEINDIQRESGMDDNGIAVMVGLGWPFGVLYLLGWRGPWR